jgi:hypothetical protein
MSDKAKVALVNMPFSYSKYPSIQLGTLSALLKSKGTPVDCHHLNVRFALKIGVPLYETPVCLSRCLSKSPRRAVIRPRSLKTWRQELRRSS